MLLTVGLSRLVSWLSVEVSYGQWFTDWFVASVGAGVYLRPFGPGAVSGKVSGPPLIFKNRGDCGSGYGFAYGEKRFVASWLIGLIIFGL